MPEQYADPVFRAQGLTKVYRMGDVEVHALRGVDLELRAGEFVVLLGPSGSGKSTLLNILGGLDVPTAGHVWYHGEDLTRAGDARLTRFRREHVGFVFQFYNLIPVLQAVENVELPLHLTVLTKKQRREHAQMALSMVGLAHRMDHYPGEMSGGEQQRVAIARAIVTDPTILVADEPTGDLDRVSAEEILSMMERLNRDMGKTIIMVTHDPRAAARARIVRHLDKGYLNDAVGQNPL